MNFTSLKDIYKEALGETDVILHALGNNAEDAELSNAIKTAKDSFEKIKNKSDEILQELDDSAEWDVLTVALYGETNAGKSTIIETLRILMGEETKNEQQKIFFNLCEKFNIDESIVDRLNQRNQEVDLLCEELKRIAPQFTGLQNERKSIENEITVRAERLTIQINSLPFLRRKVSFFWKIPEEVELRIVNDELNAFVAESQRVIQAHEDKKNRIISKIETTKKEIAEINRAIKELEAYQDGAIIGDGQSDFTRESTSYEFVTNQSKFVLLDVPGIEGKEELVRKPIMQAVRKAHVVLYVTRKADPPQKGDKKSGRKGTLEKIKEHLGSQTEVWTVFNKSIKSAEQLRMPELINKGEIDSLKVLEDEMKSQLGRHYAGNLIVSAYPAFIASSSNFIPGNTKSKDRKKFLSVMEPTEILLKTGVRSLAQKIGSDMVENAKDKIRKSNFNKANAAVTSLKENVLSLNKITFKPLYDRLESQAHDSTTQLDSATNSLIGNIESAFNKLLRKKREITREKIYYDIDQDIGNDEFKDNLEHYLDEGVKKIQEALPRIIEKQIKEFQEEVENIAIQFEEHVHEFSKDASSTGDMDFSLNIKIDSGANIAGLIGAVIGAVGLAFVSGGWALVLGAFGVMVSFAKAIWGWFDSDYKKAQQRNAADENIDMKFQSIESSYVSQIRDNIETLERNLLPIKEKFQFTVQQAKDITSALDRSVKQLELVSKKIKKEGAI